MILIYGKGKVGSAVAELMTHLGLEYTLCDDTDAPSSYDPYEMIVPSPGIPGTHAIYQTGKVVSELDFAYKYMPKGFQIVSITGTDGKSTTSWIMYNILKKEYSVKKMNSEQTHPNPPLSRRGGRQSLSKPVYLSGNFDIPFSATVLDILKKGEKRGYIVLEVSSFMSHILREFQSDYSIFTNFKVDHQNWHKDMQEYLDAKMHIMERTRRVAVINSQVPEFAREYGLQIVLPDNTRLYQTNKRDRTDGEDIIISGRKKYQLTETQLSGMHNAMNILSVGIIANEMKICSKRMRGYLRDISGLPHRLEKVGEKNGIIFVEDSKSTSSQSLEAALGAFLPPHKMRGGEEVSLQKSEQTHPNPPLSRREGDCKNLLLIVGGSDKGDVFAHLALKFRERVKAMVCIGATKDHFIRIAESEDIPYLVTDVLSEGVKWLYLSGTPGDVLILSPGCASFGLFRDYLDRAHHFRDAIKNLP